MHDWYFQEGSAKVECRYDWHQTATHVTVAIYAKNYDPDISKIEIHGARLKVHVYFPEQAGSFDLDLELAGVSNKFIRLRICLFIPNKIDVDLNRKFYLKIIDVKQTTATMAGTKLEVKMRKAEPGSWSKLFIPREVRS